MGQQGRYVCMNGNYDISYGIEKKVFGTIYIRTSINHVHAF